jgi:phosphatidylglycerophosphate synthase
MAKVKTFLQMTVVGVVMAYICLVAGLTDANSPHLALVQFDYRFWFNWLLWVTAAVTVWTGVDYVYKYFYMIRSVLK